MRIENKLSYELDRGITNKLLGIAKLSTETFSSQILDGLYSMYSQLNTHLKINLHRLIEDDQD
jgi:hypothetical protein